MTTKQFSASDGGVWFYAFKQPSFKAVMQLQEASKGKSEKDPIPPTELVKIFSPFFRVGRTEEKLLEQRLEWWEDADFSLVSKILSDYVKEFDEKIKDQNPTSPPSE